MSVFFLGGSYTSALTHFAGIGIAAILEDSGHRGVRLCWSNALEPQFELSGVNIDSDVVAGAVREHAKRHADSASWVQQTVHYRTKAKEVEVGLFSPRIAVPGSGEAWRHIYDERRKNVDLTPNSGRLDGIMRQAIGEPAYWQFGDREPQFDEGASRWEMKTRNRGEDFVRNRLAPLATSVAERSIDAIYAGLAKETVDDSAGKLDSRTGTGLVPPGPVDDAVAWCALWGISAFRIFPRVSGVARTPCAAPAGRIHPREMVLPVFAHPVSLARVRVVLRSEGLDTAAFSGLGSGPRADLSAEVARVQLRAKGVSGLVRFPIRKAGSASAPERQVLTGTFEGM